MSESPLLISDVQAAALCGCSRSHWHALAAAGKVPPSVRLGRKRLWRRLELVHRYHEMSGKTRRNPDQKFAAGN